MALVRGQPVGTVTWALYSNLARRWGAEAGSSGVPLFLLATGIAFALARAVASEQDAWTTRAAIEATAMGAATALAYGLWDGAMRRGDALLIAACSYLTPLLSTLASAVYLRVGMGARLWIGCALLVVGSLVSRTAVSPSRESEWHGTDKQPGGQSPRISDRTEVE